jgi:hypothetical protein
MRDQFCHSRDEERFHGAFDTREEAIAELGADGGWIGRVRPPREFISDALVGRLLFTDISEALGDEVGEVAECFTLKPHEQEALGKVVLDWIESGPGFRCWGVKDIERIEPSEAPHG